MATVELIISADELMELLARRATKAVGQPRFSKFGVSIEVYRFGKWTTPRSPVRARIGTDIRSVEG